MQMNIYTDIKNKPAYLFPIYLKLYIVRKKSQFFHNNKMSWFSSKKSCNSHLWKDETDDR